MSFLESQSTVIYASEMAGKVIQTGIPAVSVLKGFIYTSLAGKWYYTSKSYTSAKEILSKYGWGRRNQPKTQTLPQMGAYRCHRSWLCSMGGGIHELGDKGLWDSEFWHILFAPNIGNSLKSDWFLGSGSVLYREISPENNFHGEDTWSKKFED